MHIFIIAVALFAGLFAGLWASRQAIADGESVSQARLTLGMGWAIVSIFALTVLYALYGLAWVYWWIATLPGAY